MMQEQDHPHFRRRVTQTQQSTRTCGILPIRAADYKHFLPITKNKSSVAADHWIFMPFCIKAMAN